MCTSAIQVLSELLVEWITMYRLSKANLYFTDFFVTLVNWIHVHVIATPI